MSLLLARIKNILLQGVLPVSEKNDLRQLSCHITAKSRIRRDLGNDEIANFDSIEHDEKLNRFCKRLYDATSDTQSHYERLDEVFAELFTFEVSLRPDQTIQYVSGACYAFLKRLPPQPLGLPGVSDLPNAYFDQDFLEKETRKADKPILHGTVTWPCLKVTSQFDTNLLRLITFREIYQTQGTDGVEEKQLVDLTAEMLHTCCKLEENWPTKDQNVHNRWLVVRCFLWNSWQRAQMLYFHRLLYFRLSRGIQTNPGSLTVLRSTLVSPGLTIQQFSDQVALEGKTPYMCSWAFNLLRTDGIAVGSDFRLLHERYTQLLGHNQPRCNRDSDKSCDGSQMGNCKRFTQDVEDQSMHDLVCPGMCPKLVWDEQSYRAVKGGRAVSVSATDYDQKMLKYTAASKSTLAISHAWAHGQGGSPSTGLNQCLHIRYVQIAQKYGCDGYFIDSACIPEKHDLRKEAIRNINETFRRSKMTLVVDKDLMTIDVSTMSVELQECLLATLLVSDWSTRAWTMLEATKGRRNIQILCRRAELVSYQQLVQSVASKGRVDIAIFALVAPHLLSWSLHQTGRKDISAANPPSLESAGSLLSYRPASRLGDDLVIWSLMINQDDKPAVNEKEFWRNQQGRRVATGFLVSSAERIKEEGFTWAPKSPYAAPREGEMPSEQLQNPKTLKQFFRAFTGEESEYAEIQEDGITAKWLVFEFNAQLSKTLWRACLAAMRRSIGASQFSRTRHVSSQRGELNYISIRHLVGYRSGAIALPKMIHGDEVWSLHQHIADYSGGVRGTLVVVLGSNSSRLRNPFKRYSDRQRWTWRAVQEWPAKLELPDLKEQILQIS